MKFYSAVIFVLLVSAIAVADTSRKTDEESNLKTLVKKLTDAQLAYDSASLDKIFTADYIEISPLGEFDPRAKVLGFYSPEEKAKAGNISGSVDASEYSIRVYKDFAIVITRLNYTMTSEGKQLPPRGIRATFVCRKEKSGWKIASAQYTSIRAQQSVKTQ